MFRKPVTGSLSLDDFTCMTLRSAATPVECLVHGWDAIAAALKESSKLDGGDRAKVKKNIAYAAKQQARVARHPRADVMDEAAELAKAIADAERFF
jgi:hypothetical protein